MWLSRIEGPPAPNVPGALDLSRHGFRWPMLTLLAYVAPPLDCAVQLGPSLINSGRRTCANGVAPSTPTPDWGQVRAHVSKGALSSVGARCTRDNPGLAARCSTVLNTQRAAPNAPRGSYFAYHRRPPGPLRLASYRRRIYVIRLFVVAILIGCHFFPLFSRLLPLLPVSVHSTTKNRWGRTRDGDQSSARPPHRSQAWDPRTPLLPRCERLEWTVPPSQSGRTVQSVPRRERSNRNTVTRVRRWASRANCQGGLHASVHRDRLESNQARRVLSE